MEIKEIIDVLRVCTDDEIICPACPRYDRGVYGSGTADCYQNLMLEAADAIESQQKRIAELEALREQEERRWIPVTERLPEKTGTYFVVTKTGAVTFARFYPEHDFIDCTGKFIRHEKGNFQTNRNVIYWMPLPEPPKEV